ncbi:glutamate racemase [Anaerovorax odorimutans]|uniref:Glutamate racemase n=1 Tax=Anaerovorax odorimutans TaxID=109327 RepID=A0ABT1RLB9_9FIRM|nr:glutamate racemase [Anaerovorax odorimutans]MCQ4635990.1 glutamate racemase [Anaerovorax odorimutans]
MDNRPIGFFDSGLGGLTCIPNLMKTFPKERIIYFGDTARTPYGSKATSTIKSFSMQIADFLVRNNVKMIVIACNTVSATCLEELQERFPDVPVVGIIRPAAETIVRSCSTMNKIGIIGTKVTIQSGAYKEQIHSLNDEMDIYETPCPAFVPLIEEGIIQNDIMDLTIKYYMDDFILENRLDTIVLGCTHYPLIRSNIKRIYPSLRIINPSEEIIHSIEKILREKDMLAGDFEFENVFYASDLSENFVNMIERIFHEEDIKVKFKNLELEAVEEKK